MIKIFYLQEMYLQLPNHQSFFNSSICNISSSSSVILVCLVYHEIYMFVVRIYLHCFVSYNFRLLYKHLFNNLVIFFLFNQHFPIFVRLDFLFKQILRLHCIMCCSWNIILTGTIFISIYILRLSVIHIEEKNWFIFQNFMKHQWITNEAFLMNM